MRLFSKLPKNQQRKKTSDKQQQAQNIKDPILETFQDTASILRTEFISRQKTIESLMLVIEMIATGPSNSQALLIPLEEWEEPEEQHQHELQPHQEHLTQQQQLDTWQYEMQEQQVKLEHQQQQQRQTQEQLQTRSEELLK